MNARNLLIATLVIVSMVASGVLAGACFAQRADVPKHQDKVTLGSGKVKELLLLMDTDKNGKISKQEWMKFMEAEFDRLDKNKTGELDAKDLRLSNVAVTRKSFPSVGK